MNVLGDSVYLEERFKLTKLVNRVVHGQSICLCKNASQRFVLIGFEGCPAHESMLRQITSTSLLNTFRFKSQTYLQVAFSISFKT